MWYYINIKSLDVMHDLYIYSIHLYTWCILQLLLLIVYMQRYSHLKINSFLATFVRTLTQKITKIKKSMEVEAHRVLYFRIICYLMSSFINHTAFCLIQMSEKSSNDRHFPLWPSGIQCPCRIDCGCMPEGEIPRIVPNNCMFVGELDYFFVTQPFQATYEFKVRWHCDECESEMAFGFPFSW